MDLVNTKSDRNGKIAAVIYTLVVVLLMFLKTCSTPTENYDNEGVIVNLGFTESGKSDNTPEAVQEEIFEEVTPQEVVEEVTPQDVVEESVTQETEVVEVTATETVTEVTETAEVVEEVVEEQTQEVVEEVVEEVLEEQQVDESALFNSDNNNPNQGEGTENGDQGNPDGSLESNIYGDITGPGLGEVGKGWGLNGRSLGSKPTPVSEKQEYGVVTIKIRVGKNGKVVSAQFTSKGSTTTDKYLIDLSIKEAKKVTFNPDSKAPDVQIGFVSFHYKAS
jgi:hypothetical protein